MQVRVCEAGGEAAAFTGPAGTVFTRAVTQNGVCQRKRQSLFSHPRASLQQDGRSQRLSADGSGESRAKGAVSKQWQDRHSEI
jgi:hypothetical protein